MVAFSQVHEFVDDDVLQAVDGLLDQLQIQPDASVLGVAGSPFGFHPLHALGGRSRLLEAFWRHPLAAATR